MFQRWFANHLRALVLDKLRELREAYFAGDGDKVEKILDWVGEQIGYKADLLAVSELVQAVASGESWRILDEVGDLCKQAATHLKPSQGVLVGTFADPVAVAFDNVTAITAPRVAATPGEQPKPEFIAEAVAIITLIVRLLEWRQNRRKS